MNAREWGVDFLEDILPKPAPAKKVNFRRTFSLKKRSCTLLEPASASTPNWRITGGEASNSTRGTSTKILTPSTSS